ncbi:MAG: LacI family DNA-binding transcriptional regulator [Anaerolineales bacterium]|nr:LacI family DNA-binding transcriptional regulator [Anaerolineales bacterium]
MSLLHCPGVLRKLRNLSQHTRHNQPKKRSQPSEPSTPVAISPQPIDIADIIQYSVNDFRKRLHPSGSGSAIVAASVSMQEVARVAGVSNATVSRVLNNREHVSQATRERVQAAIEQLNYRPSRVARSLRVNRSRILGLLVSDIQNPFFTALARAVDDVAFQHQYTVFLCNSDENTGKEALYLDLMVSENVAGIIITPSRETDSPCQQLISQGLPMVAVDRRLLDVDIDTVVIDNVGGAYQLVTNMIADGHRDIAAIVGSQTITTGRERYEGYLKALADHGLTPRPEMIFKVPPTESSGYQSALRLLQRPDRPTAIFTGNNLLTVGALRAVYELNLRVGEDIALGTFDEMSLMTLLLPDLNVVAQPTYEIGSVATQLLLNRIADPSLPTQQVVLKPTLLSKDGNLAYYRQSARR